MMDLASKAIPATRNAPSLGLLGNLRVSCSICGAIRDQGTHWGGAGTMIQPQANRSVERF